jgi:hypothetical protein
VSGLEIDERVKHDIVCWLTQLIEGVVDDGMDLLMVMREILK